MISEAEIVGEGVLIMRTPVLIESGQRYWVDVTFSSLVVEDEEGHQHRFDGNFERRCNP